MSIPTGRAFAKALEEAGVISDLNTVQRVIIDVNGWDAVRVYVQRIGDQRLLDAISGPLGMMLADADLGGARGDEPGRADCGLLFAHPASRHPKVTTEGHSVGYRRYRYWVAFPSDLIDVPGTCQALADAGLREIERCQRRDAHSRMLLIEDDNPPAGVGGRQVELIIERADGGGIRIAGKRVACCDMHGRQCEPPGELCCSACVEANHPHHPAGEPCAAPDLSGAVTI